MQSEPVQPDRPFDSEPIPADLLAWARQTLDVDDFLERMREIEKGGGVSLESFIAELEERACGS